MPDITGNDLARAALRKIGILDPIEPGHAEQLAVALSCGTDLLDEWRTQKLTVPAVTRSVYPLVSGTQSYSIGPGATFAQDYPTAIEQWAVVPQRAASNPDEIPMGRPLNFEEWAAIRMKSQAGAYPTRMYFDRTSDANYRGNVLFSPIPNVTTVDVVLYQYIAILTSLVAGTTYHLRPGYANAIKLGLAVACCDEFGVEPSQSLTFRAARALGNVKRANKTLVESGIRAEFIIGSGAGRRTFNIYAGSS